MRLQPRQQLLEVWEAAARMSYRGGQWRWGGRDGSNSISDAEQLLCFMYPASELSGLKLDVPDSTADDVLKALSHLGDSIQIPRLLLQAIGEYLHKYTDGDRPVFSGGSYFSPSDPELTLTEKQRSLDVVDSFSMSVTLMLGTLGFLKVFRKSVTRDTIRRQIRELEEMASKRLSASMVGLLRSFTVNVFSPDSPEGRRLLKTVNQTGADEWRIREDLREKLKEVRAGLRDLTIGSGQVAKELDNENLLFECGWTWGIVKGAPQVKTDEEVGEQPDGLAPDVPFLYFTVIALVGIVDLFSERTRVLGLLNDHQLKLAQALQLRWDLTQLYWRTIATYGKGRWPLQDIPWRTTDGKESEYYSLLVTAMVVQGLVSSRSKDDVDLERVADVLETLAERGRITVREIAGDQVIAMHSPGMQINLQGSAELGPHMVWTVSDFPITLLKRTIWASSIAQSIRTRERLLNLADGIWDHIYRRRLDQGVGRGLWDQPANVFRAVEQRHELPSWYFSERVVEFLVEAAKTTFGKPLRSTQLVGIAGQLLAEADHLLAQELVQGPVRNGGNSEQTQLQAIQKSLHRARLLINDRPATAVALAIEALREIDRLAAVRENVTGAF